MKNTKNIKDKEINHGLVVKIELLILAVEAIAGIVIFTSTIPSVREAVTMATTVKPETFTELYFEDHINLPKRIELGKEQSFKFTIHNLEYQDTTYPYQIEAIDDKEEITLSSGSATLAQNEYKTFDESYVLATASGRTKIQVLLVDRKQLIDFWLEK